MQGHGAGEGRTRTTRTKSRTNIINKQEEKQLQQQQKQKQTQQQQPQQQLQQQQQQQQLQNKKKNKSKNQNNNNNTINNNNIRPCEKRNLNPSHTNTSCARCSPPKQLMKAFATANSTFAAIKRDCALPTVTRCSLSVQSPTKPAISSLWLRPTSSEA